MWEAIGLVSSGLTLVAFIVAAATRAFRSANLRTEGLIRTAPEEDRAVLVDKALARFQVATSDLTKAQRFEIAMKELQQQADRSKTTAHVVTVVAILMAIIAIVALSKASFGNGPPPPNKDWITQVEFNELRRLGDNSLEATIQILIQVMTGDLSVKDGAKSRWAYRRDAAGWIGGHLCEQRRSTGDANLSSIKFDREAVAEAVNRVFTEALADKNETGNTQLLQNAPNLITELARWGYSDPGGVIESMRNFTNSLEPVRDSKKRDGAVTIVGNSIVAIRSVAKLGRGVEDLPSWLISIENAWGNEHIGRCCSAGVPGNKCGNPVP